VVHGHVCACENAGGAGRTEEVRVLRKVEVGAGGQAPALDGLAVVRLRGLYLAREQAQVPAAPPPVAALPLSGQRQRECTTAVRSACAPLTALQALNARCALSHF